MTKQLACHQSGIYVLTLENVRHMEVVSVTLQNYEFQNTLEKSSKTFVQNLLLHNLKDSKGFLYLLLNKTIALSLRCSYLVKVDFCAVMSDTNMLTTSYSRFIIFQ